MDERLEIRGRKNEQYYKGNSVLCPCCGKTFSRFMDFNISKEHNFERFRETYKNKVCPYCFSMPRHRIASYYFENIMGGGGDIIIS
jgi:uncharacterized Zn-finger protein